ncbi:MAG: hypothetical protein PF549_04435 [Patescibacteria group bacterium]|jgi:hypothetical protein|nr:hypothetical protein [Patescibacteria group bacterium]
MYKFNKILEARKKGLKIMEDLRKEKRKIELLISNHQSYDEQRMYERIIDSLTRCIDDVRRAIL